ncbi:DUF6456 domain-containing protein, partial [Sandarakinorhabdus sp.]|uniref:DUF6456 domain-containing protein n=1 Tax=Sandarakinorhabdus sp. TaxID=1916663 RepID=UPI00286D70D1
MSSPSVADIAPEPRNRILSQRRLAPADAVDRQAVTVNLAESPLAWLARRGLVSAAQFSAGERLRHDFMMAGHAPRITMRWDPVRGTRGAHAADPATSQIAARQRFDAACAAAGPGLSDVLWRVVCLGEGLETAERALAWPAR